jgi:hypothetical protein
MPPLRDPKNQIVEGVEYVFARVGERFGITSGAPDSRATEGLSETVVIPDDAGKLTREGDRLSWFGESIRYRNLYNVPREGQRQVTIESAREIFSKFNHSERRR